MRRPGSGPGRRQRRPATPASSASRDRKRPTSRARSPCPKPSKSRKPWPRPVEQYLRRPERAVDGDRLRRLVAHEAIELCQERLRIGQAARRQRGADSLEEPPGRLQLGPRRSRRTGDDPAAVQRDQPVGGAFQRGVERPPGGVGGAAGDQVGERPVAGERGLQEGVVLREVGQRLGEAGDSGVADPALPQRTHPRVRRGAVVVAIGLGDDLPRPAGVRVRDVHQLVDDRGALPGLVTYDVGLCPAQTEAGPAGLPQCRLQQWPGRDRVGEDPECRQAGVALHRGDIQPQVGEQQCVVPGAWCATWGRAFGDEGDRAGAGRGDHLRIEAQRPGAPGPGVAQPDVDQPDRAGDELPDPVAQLGSAPRRDRGRRATSRAAAVLRSEAASVRNALTSSPTRRCRHMTSVGR